MATAGTITNIEIVTEKINGVSIKGYNKDNGKFQPLQPTPAPTLAPTPEPTPEPTPAPTPAPTEVIEVRDDSGRLVGLIIDGQFQLLPEPTPDPTPEPTPEPTTTEVIEVRDDSGRLVGLILDGKFEALPTPSPLEPTPTTSPVPPPPPIAVDDEVTTNQNQAVSFNVLENDIDPIGTPLSIINFSLPTNGSLVENDAGTFTYTPRQFFIGTDSFSYETSNGTTSSLTTVNIRILSEGGPIKVEGVFRGTPDNEFLIGGDQIDVIFGAGGDDSIFGQGSNDEIRGDADNDVIHGNQGNDTVIGNQGNDNIRGGKDDDLVVGEDGNDILLSLIHI